MDIGESWILEELVGSGGKLAGFVESVRASGYLVGNWLVTRIQASVYCWLYSGQVVDNYPVVSELFLGRDLVTAR